MRLPPLALARIIGLPVCFLAFGVLSEPHSSLVIRISSFSPEPPLAEIQKDKRQTYQKVWQKRLQKPEPSDAERVSWWLREYHLER